ncbi:hypothetical protein Q8A73_016283 [Channa argus]|nr:hypothetical protein Q8A73_016283 [Channa argus]
MAEKQRESHSLSKRKRATTAEHPAVSPDPGVSLSLRHNRTTCVEKQVHLQSLRLHAKVFDLIIHLTGSGRILSAPYSYQSPGPIHRTQQQTISSLSLTAKRHNQLGVIPAERTSSSNCQHGPRGSLTKLSLKTPGPSERPRASRKPRCHRSIYSEPRCIPPWLDSSVPMRGPQGPLVS